MVLCELLQEKRARRNAVGSRSVICAYHLMFLPVWHLFGLKPGKLVRLHCQQCVQQPDCPKGRGDWQGEVYFLHFYPLCPNMWAGPWSVIFSRRQSEKRLGLCFKTIASTASTSRNAEEGGRFPQNTPFYLH